DSPHELTQAFSADRTRADRVLQEINARLNAVPRRSPLRGCQSHRPSPGGALVVRMAVPDTGLVVRALGDQPAEVKLRRFGDRFENAGLGQVEHGQPRFLNPPTDRSPRPYVAQITSAGPFAICLA